MHARVSDLAGRTVIDTRVRTVGYLCELVVDWLANEPPSVNGLLVQRGKYIFFLSMNDVGHLVSSRTRLILVDQEPVLSFYREHSRDVLLVRDVIGQQLIDLRIPRVVRAQDVLLVESADDWQVASVDVGMHAHRSLCRVLGRTIATELLPWTNVGFLPGRIASDVLSGGTSRLADFPPSAIASIVASLPPHEATAILCALDHVKATELFLHLPVAQRAAIVAALRALRG